uniref:Polyadenylate-binding protein-interacting protein 1 n=1 Tax=Fundulus heteroclitus TaxID=8078 RepID=A0A3Q2QBX9_FUNHE
MNESFDRAPGAGRARGAPADPGLPVNARDGDAKTSLFSQREPLRQPRTVYASVSRGGNDDVDSVVRTSTLSASAPEFVPGGMSSYEEPAYYDDSESYYGEASLADTVTDFLSHLSSSPGSFESDVEYITGILNSWVTTEELLKELVELIFTQSTAIPNFSYTGARLCNYLSHHLALSPQGAKFRQLLLQRCQREYEQRNEAVRGSPEVQKKFHSFVLFLGELYLNLEIKSATGPPNRAEILLLALKDLLQSLLSHPVDANLICAVKLLKVFAITLVTPVVWASPVKRFLTCFVSLRDVRQMLLKLVELRSSDWGRVCVAAATSNATPDNDPNYFMNEPTFYTEDGTPFTAADPGESKDKFPNSAEAGRNKVKPYDFDDEMDPEIEEAYESFCLESEKKRQQ